MQSTRAQVPAWVIFFSKKNFSGNAIIVLYPEAQADLRKHLRVDDKKGFQGDAKSAIFCIPAGIQLTLFSKRDFNGEWSQEEQQVKGKGIGTTTSIPELADRVYSFRWDHI